MQSLELSIPSDNEYELTNYSLANVNLEPLFDQFHSKKIQKITLKDCTLSKLAPNCNLEFVEFLNLDMNLLEDTGVIQLAGFVESSKIKVLSLRGNGITTTGLSVLLQLVPSTLKELYLSQNAIDDQGVVQLVDYMNRNSNLTTLHVSYNRISVEGARMFAHAFRNGCRLARFSIMNNFIGSEVLTLLCKSIQESVYITELIMGQVGLYSSVEDASVLESAFAALVAKNTPLESLIIFGLTGCASMLKALTRNSLLRQLVILRCTDDQQIIADLHEHFPKLLQNTTLEALKISGNFDFSESFSELNARNKAMAQERNKNILTTLQLSRTALLLPLPVEIIHTILELELKRYPVPDRKSLFEFFRDREQFGQISFTAPNVYYQTALYGHLVSRMRIR